MSVPGVTLWSPCRTPSGSRWSALSPAWRRCRGTSSPRRPGRTRSSRRPAVHREPGAARRASRRYPRCARSSCSPPGTTTCCRCPARRGAAPTPAGVHDAVDRRAGGRARCCLAARVPGDGARAGPGAVGPSVAVRRSPTSACWSSATARSAGRSRAASPAFEVTLTAVASRARAGDDLVRAGARHRRAARPAAAARRRGRDRAADRRDHRPGRPRVPRRDARRRAAGQRGPRQGRRHGRAGRGGAAGRLQAALDVTDPEPLPDGHPLWHSPGVLITPHVGGATQRVRAAGGAPGRGASSPRCVAGRAAAATSSPGDESRGPFRRSVRRVGACGQTPAMVEHRGGDRDPQGAVAGAQRRTGGTGRVEGPQFLMTRGAQPSASMPRRGRPGCWRASGPSTGARR